MKIEHPAVVAYNENGEGVVPCVALAAEGRHHKPWGDEIWVLCHDKGFDDPNSVVVLTTYRSPGLFWMPLSKLDCFDLEQIMGLLDTVYEPNIG